MQRVDLVTGAVITVLDDLVPPGSARAECADVAFEPGGTHVLVAQPGGFGAVAGRLIRMELTTGAVTVIAFGFGTLGQLTCGVGGLAVEPGVTSVLVADRANGLRRVTLPPW